VTSERPRGERFTKELRNRDVLTLAFGAMIGWSWVLMTGLWVGKAGSLGTLLAFLGGGLAIALIGLTYSELVSAMPQAGGEHVCTHRGLGIGASFFCTWALLLAYVNVCLFEAVAMAMPPAALAARRLASGDAATLLWGHASARSLVVLGGVAGILTSWNAFVIGASRLLFALAESGLVPAVFARLHPRYHTLYVGIIAIGALCCLSPLFGRTVLVWLVDAGGFSTIVAYLFVPLAFLALRRKEPDLPRPFRVSHPRFVGVAAFVLALALIAAYLPGNPSALVWPYEWLTITIWAVLGVALFARYRHASFQLAVVSEQSLEGHPEALQQAVRPRTLQPFLQAHLRRVFEILLEKLLHPAGKALVDDDDADLIVVDKAPPVPVG
jgi:amino acid transporter